MQELPEPSRVSEAGNQQEQQKFIQTKEDVPARYRNYPTFDELHIDSAHNGHTHGKVIREAMAAIEADLSGAIKGPVTRPESGYIDFYDGEGYPFDIKTPLSPSAQDKWEFSAYQNADTILKQLDKTHENKFSGKQEPVAVLLDTTYISEEDRTNLWRELRKQTKENRSILKNIFEVNVKLDNTAEMKKESPKKQPLSPAMLAIKQRMGR